MTRVGAAGRLCALVLLASLLIGGAPGTALAQQFNSGSTGVNGAFPPAPAADPMPTNHSWIVWNMRTGKVSYCGTYTVNTGLDVCDPGSNPDVQAQIPGIPAGGVADGVYNFTSFTLATVTGVHRSLIVVGTSPNTPLTILASGEISMTGLPASGWTSSFHVRGGDGRNPSASAISLAVAGGLGGPGGFDGGASGNGGTTPSDGSAGFGPAGGAPGLNTANFADFGALSGTATALNPSLSPLTGGSGGGGGAGISAAGVSGCSANNYAGGSGGGGGGALLLSSSIKVTIGANAIIYAHGGNGGSSGNSCGYGGGGAGGNVRVVSHEITGTGTIQVHGGNRPGGPPAGAGGYVRFESSANTFTGGITGAAGGSFVSFPTAPVPSIQPKLQISSIGPVGNTVSVTDKPVASLANPDVSFATPVSTVALTVNATNVPEGTTINIKVTPALGNPTTATATVGSGGTAQASVVLPPGAGIITATASFSVVAGMFNDMRFDGDLAQRMEVETQPDGTSKTFVIARSGARFEIGARQ